MQKSQHSSQNREGQVDKVPALYVKLGIHCTRCETLHLTVTNYPHRHTINGLGHRFLACLLRVQWASMV